MTAAEWLACADPIPMLTSLGRRGSERKLRLFACACCGRIRHLMPDSRHRNIIREVEQFADTGRGTYQRKWDEEPEIYRGSARTASSAVAVLVEWRGHPNPAHQVAQAAACAAQGRDYGYYDGDPYDGDLNECWEQARLLRCIFGNPFRLVTLAPSWLTSTVVALAEGIYADRAFDRLPILADALQDAGCEHSDVLDHCHSDGPHVRGCWVVDLLLGKS